MQRLSLITVLVGSVLGTSTILALIGYRELPAPPATISRTPDRIGVPQATDESEAYAVYSALIREMYIGDTVKLLVIYRETSGCVPATNNEKIENIRRGMEEYAIKNLPDLSEDTLNDFQAKKKECHNLKEQFDIPVKYVLVTTKDIKPLFHKGAADDGWERFYSRYPKSSGRINFSSIGFNRERTQALVSTARWCGGRCGAGHYVLLVKTDNIWSIRSKVRTWVS